MNSTGKKQSIFSNLATCIVLSVFSMHLLPSLCLGQQAAASGYETPGILKASEILPPELLEGDHYKVMEEVATYDFTNRFTISTPYGQFEVIGEDMLRIRIQEILAIAALQEIKKSKAFRDAAEQAAMSPLKGARNLVIHPVERRRYCHYRICLFRDIFHAILWEHCLSLPQLRQTDWSGAGLSESDLSVCFL